MKATRTTLLAVFAVVVVAGVVTVSIPQKETPPPKRVESSVPQVPANQSEAPSASPAGPVSENLSAPVQAVVDPDHATKLETPASQNSRPQSGAATKQPKPKRELQDPVARFAMRFVGADPEAEAYWLAAIFDSSLPDKERDDLIEDLNEEGLSDTKRPGPEDFPLIMNRIAILEEIAPYADDFMLPHMAEAYKDLWNLAAITQGGGEPVR